METFTSNVVIAHPVQDVFEWHERPGALVRLWPPWSGSVVSGPSNGLRPGSRSTLRLTVPGTFGLAGIEWVAEHVDYEPPHYFSDVQAKGPMRSWRHYHRFIEADNDHSTRLNDEVAFEFPVPAVGPLAGLAVTRTLERTFQYRSRQLSDDMAFHEDHPGDRLTIAVAGASGTIGTQLCALLGTGGHTVRRLVRRAAESDAEISWDPRGGTIDRRALEGVDVVIHLGGRTIGGRFTTANKKAIRDSRLESTRLLSETIAEIVREGQPITFVCGSAIGFYGSDRGDEVLHEAESAGRGFMADLCRDWEKATSAAAEAGARVVNVRTGVVQTPASGALGKQLPLFKMGVGGPLGNGSQWLSWISVDDIASVFAHAALTPTITGPLNAVAPEPVTATDYARTLARVLHRPALVPVPQFGPELLLGREGAREVVAASQRVSASLLMRSGFQFRHPTLEDALRHVLGR